MDLKTVWSSKDLIMAGLAYTVMGILIVFLILVIIMLVIKAMELFSGEKKSDKKQQTSLAENTPAPQTQPVTVEAVPAKADDRELIAVITAAVAAVMEQNTSDFVVRSYKKVSGGAWNKAGRRDVLDNRF